MHGICCNVGFVGVKLDMMKAYNRIKWNYVLRVMGFPAKIVKIIASCMSTMSFSLLMNGKRCGFISLEHSVKHGDPLSSFLFLFCVKGLVSLIKKTKVDGCIRGFWVSRSAPSITNLFFADDNILYFRALQGDCEPILQILDTYERVYGQKINTKKSSLFFS